MSSPASRVAGDSESGQTTRRAPLSSIELDPDDPPPETSTLKQPTRRAALSSIELDPDDPPPETSTLKQPTRRAPLSSIELDPDNPPPETPLKQNEPTEPVTEQLLTRRERIKIQLPIWREHISAFRYHVCAATIIALLAISCFIVGYVIQMKMLFLGIASGLGAVCFSFIWLTIAPGPPFESDAHGREIIPPYLYPQVINVGSSGSIRQFYSDQAPKSSSAGSAEPQEIGTPTGSAKKQVTGSPSESAEKQVTSSPTRSVRSHGSGSPTGSTGSRGSTSSRESGSYDRKCRIA